MGRLPFFHAGTQSDYRESEAQTLPWSPDWVQPTNPAVLAKQAALCAKFNIAGPEVLQLAHLTFGNGLPGTCTACRRPAADCHTTAPGSTCLVTCSSMTVMGPHRLTAASKHARQHQQITVY